MFDRVVPLVLSTMDLTLPDSQARFVKGLLDWFHDNQRSLPWRQERDAYRIWVSEIMLQQTRVAVVLPYFERFLAAFPRIEDLAAADLEKVLSLWSGLGYYSRARNLHRAAKLICRQHGGEFPSDPASALALPGVGRYTAGAVLSIAYGRRLPVLDGNIRRILIRYLAIRRRPDGAVERALWKLLEQLVGDGSLQADESARDRDRPCRVGDFNQALMELGALVCTPRAPRCHQCPLANGCRSRREGLQEVLPRKKLSRSPEELHFAVAVVRRDQAYLLRRNTTEPFLRGFWDFPRVSGRPGHNSAERFQQEHGLLLEVGRAVPLVRHQITFRRLHFHPLLCDLKGGQPPDGWLWSDLEKARFPVSAHVRKIAGAASSQSPASR